MKNQPVYKMGSHVQAHPRQRGWRPSLCIASLCHGPFHQSPPLLYEMMVPPLMSVIGTDHFYKVNLLIPFHSGNRCSFYRGPIMGDQNTTCHAKLKTEQHKSPSKPSPITRTPNSSHLGVAWRIRFFRGLGMKWLAERLFERRSHKPTGTPTGSSKVLLQGDSGG